MYVFVSCLSKRKGFEIRLDIICVLISLQYESILEIIKGWKKLESKNGRENKDKKIRKSG